MRLEDRNEPVNLRMLYVRGENNQLVQLDNLVKVVEKKVLHRNFTDSIDL